ncbi:MAG TPA: beta-propeller domain-containing protein [Longimicrobium sp.]|nr:beta-propeller domain-containing protein [Longimicrobium sp.]
MKTRTILLLAAAAVITGPVLTVALPAPAPVRGPTPPRAASLTAFASQQELRAYLRGLAREQAERVARQQAARAGCGTPAPGRGRAGPVAVIGGRVTDPHGKPLPGATVCVRGTTARAITGPGGVYRLTVPAGQLAGAAATVVASAAQAGPDQRTVRLAATNTATVNFALDPVTPEYEVVADMAAPLEVTAAPAGIGKAGGAAESVTNTQTTGVDEGGIVKVHGDHLVMLRRGRLFTVAIGDGRLAPVSSVNAYGPGMDPSGTWYDEMLVSGDRVVVIGYSYQRGGTEVGVFDIDAAGRLGYRGTWHLRSNDYYSSRNYASRLVGNTLLFYTPLSARVAEDGGLDWLPALRRWHEGVGENEWQPIAAAPRIYRPGRPLDAMDGVTLHTVTACDLSRPELACRATGVLGPSGRVFYVSESSVYVWTSDWRRARGERSPAMVYRLPLDGAAPTALAVAWSPVDQFSFVESDGQLNVVVREDAAGDGMWRAERSAGPVRLLRVPLARFGDGTGEAPQSAYRPLPGRFDASTFQNRFVGRHLLYGGGSGWGAPQAGERWPVYVAPVAGGAVSELTLPHGVDRIEVMGNDAVVVGTDGRDLHFTGIALGARPSLRQHYVSPGASQGELRSHGFFYKPDAGDGDSGVLGLPVRGPGRPGYEHLYNGSASIVFLRNQGGAFRPLGELEARPEGSPDDGCVASCMDWYGNARPLFLRGRTFALLGYEIVEGQVVDGRLRELRRVSYAPRRAEASR